MAQLGDVRKLKNVAYRTESRKVCAFKVLGPGALRVGWLFNEEPTDADMKEVSAWVKDILGATDVIEYTGELEGEAETLKEFYRESGF